MSISSIQNATAKKDIGILFGAPMVLAEHAGLKTQTRRVVVVPAGSRGETDVPQPKGDFWSPALLDGKLQWRANLEPSSLWPRKPVPCPYGKPGGRLWVREAWRAWVVFDHEPPRNIPEEAQIQYDAIGDGRDETRVHWGKYRHARFMCRWMSRTLLEVTEVRVERLQSISEADAKAEGAEPHDWLVTDPQADALIDWPCKEAGHPYRNGYALLWETIHGDRSWEANPWVWAVSFKRITP